MYCRFLGEIDTVSVDRIFVYIKRKSASVEVKMGGDCFRLPFRVPDVCLALQAHPKFMTDASEKLQDIPRDNPEQKVLALINNMRVILREMHHVGKILKHPLLWPLASVKLVIEFVPFWIAIWVTLCILFFYENDENPWEVTAVGPAVGKLVLVLNIFQTMCVMVLIWSYVVVDAPMKVIPGACCLYALCPLALHALPLCSLCSRSMFSNLSLSVLLSSRSMGCRYLPPSCVTSVSQYGLR